MPSVLAPIAAAAYRNNHLEWYGAIEVDRKTKETIWKFDATQTEFKTARIYEEKSKIKHEGFRPSSVERLSDGRTLIGGWRRGLLVDEEGEVNQFFTHELMNDVHEIQTTKKNTYLVTSTGMDTILELDEDFNEIWRWHMWENVSSNFRPNCYYPNNLNMKDKRDFAQSPDNRYHLNYATEYRDDMLLCSALNYGVFIVNKDNGKIIKKMTHICECHNPYPCNGNLIVAESGKDRIVSVNWKGKKTVMLDEGLSFAKDVDPIHGTDQWLITDTKNDRILIWDKEEDKFVDKYLLGKMSKPYEADFLEG